MKNIIFTTGFMIVGICALARSTHYPHLSLPGLAEFFMGSILFGYGLSNFEERHRK